MSYLFTPSLNKHSPLFVKMFNMIATHTDHMTVICTHNTHHYVPLVHTSSQTPDTHMTKSHTHHYVPLVHTSSQTPDTHMTKSHTHHYVPLVHTSSQTPDSAPHRITAHCNFKQKLGLKITIGGDTPIVFILYRTHFGQNVAHNLYPPLPTPIPTGYTHNPL